MTFMPTTGFDPAAFRRQQVFSGLGGLGAGLMAASFGNNPGQAIAGGLQGLNQAMDPTALMRMQLLQEQLHAARTTRETEAARLKSYRDMIGKLSGPGSAGLGASPQAGGLQVVQGVGSGGLMDPQTAALLQNMDPEAGSRLMFQHMTRDPKGLVNYFNPSNPVERKAVSPGSPEARSLAGSGWVRGDPASPPAGFRRKADGSGLEVDEAYRQFALDRAAAGRTRIVNQNNVGPTGIDYGDPGKGLVWQRNKAGEIVLDERGAPIAIPFQGGEVYLEQQEKAEKEAAKAKSAGLYADVVTQDVDRTIGLIRDADLPTTGFFGNILKDVPGLEANNVRALVDGIRANIGFDRLQSIRDASPTGGALGPVSDFENRLMQATIGSLEQSQTKDQFLFNLARVKRIYTDIVTKGIKPGEFGAYKAQPTSGGPGIGAVVDGYLFMGGDPGNQTNWYPVR